MSKGLEKLKEIKNDVVAEYIDDYKEHFEIIEKELKEWDYFDSELKKYHITKTFLKQFLDLLSICNSENGVKLVKFISENNVYDFQKKLQTLEIIRNKQVDVALFVKNKSAVDYNGLRMIMFRKQAERDYSGVLLKYGLTQEEYDLLKEVLL